MTHARLNIYTGCLTFLVVALALLNWKFTPGSSNSWLAAIITMPFIWLFANFGMKRAVCGKLNELELKFFTSSVILAGLLLAFSLAAKFIGNIYDIDPSLIRRARNVFSGFVLLYFANMMPKMIGPALKARCSSPAANAVRRFAGWALVLGAIGYIGAWIFAPMSHASIIAQICVGTAVVLVVLRIIYAILTEQRAGV